MLAVHIKKPQAATFCPTVTDRILLVRRTSRRRSRLAYFTYSTYKNTFIQLAKRCKLKHIFNEEKFIAGYDGFYEFLQRNPDIYVRKSEGLSLTRIHGYT